MNIYESITKAAADGKRWSVCLHERSCSIDGKTVINDDGDIVNDDDILGVEPMPIGEVMDRLHELYGKYKHSIPSERSERKSRHAYFKALTEDELTDEDFMRGDNRLECQARLEMFVLGMVLNGSLRWQDGWGSWFWQSDKDKDLVLLRSWL